MAQQPNIRHTRHLINHQIIVYIRHQTTTAIMKFSVFLSACVATLSASVPIASPASTQSFHLHNSYLPHLRLTNPNLDFEANPLLHIGNNTVSSYATKRSNFKADPLFYPDNNEVPSKRTIFEASPNLDIGNEDVSSYATKRGNFEADRLFYPDSSEGSSKRANFEASPMLDIGNEDVSSYAS